jgi:hypothetical protein
VIADAVYHAFAGVSFYRATVRSLISHGFWAGLIPRNWTGRLIDAAASRRRINQEDLKDAGEFGLGRALLKWTARLT